MVMLCLLGLIVATFTQINLSHYWLHKDSTGAIEVILKNYPYIPQIPVLLASVALLGTRFSILTLLLYVLMGFFLWPVFALGGGVGYIKSTFFGYILGYFPAVIIAGRLLCGNKTLKKVILASLFGVLIIHICGILYSMILGMFHLVDFSFIFATIVSLTGKKICYDWVASIIAITVAIPLKYIFWLGMDNGVTGKKKKKEKRIRRKN